MCQQTFTGIQACNARRTAICQLRQIAQPCIVKVIALRFLIYRLRIIPVYISTIYVVLWVSADAAHITSRKPHQHSVGSEEGHLRVIANQCLSITIKLKLCDSLVAISCQNCIPAHKLNRITEGITRRSSHQTTTDTIFHPSLALLFFFVKASYIFPDKCLLLLCFRSDTVCRLGHLCKTSTQTF